MQPVRTLCAHPCKRRPAASLQPVGFSRGRVATLGVPNSLTAFASPWQAAAIRYRLKNAGIVFAICAEDLEQHELFSQGSRGQGEPQRLGGGDVY